MNFSQLKMANKSSPTSSTMDNLIVLDRAQIQPMSGVEPIRNSISDNAEPETIVSSTEHTTIDAIDNRNRALNKNYAIDAKSSSRKSSTGEYRKSAKSHVDIVTAIAPSNQSKSLSNESKHRSEKSKTSEKGSKSIKRSIANIRFPNPSLAKC